MTIQDIKDRIALLKINLNYSTFLTIAEKIDIINQINFLNKKLNMRSK